MMKMRRRARVWRLAALLMLGAALWGLWAEREAPYKGEPPPLSAETLARTRLDGGQMLGLADGVPPHELSRLNLGFQLDFKTAPPDLLGRLPGLGPRSIARGRERGHLTDYQSRRAKGLLMNYEAESGNATESSPDHL